MMGGGPRLRWKVWNGGFSAAKLHVYFLLARIFRRAEINIVHDIGSARALAELLNLLTLGSLDRLGFPMKAMLISTSSQSH